MYLKILPMQIFGIIVNATNSLIDGIVTQKVLGEKAFSATGLFGPVATVIGVTSVITVGMQILIGQYIGSYDKKKIERLFATGVLFLAAVALGVTAVLLLLNDPLATILGASDPELKQLLIRYMQGYAIGVIGQVFSGLSLQLLPYNNKTKLAYAGVGILVVTNVSLDFVFSLVCGMGTFGMGLATSISYLASSAVMFCGLLSRKNTIFFRFAKPDVKLLLNAAYRGLPSLAFTLGIALKGFILNRTLIKAVGHEMIAVMNEQGTLCSFLGAIPVGAAAAYLSLSSIFYGEEDRQSLLAAFKYAMIFGLSFSAALVILLMSGSSLISSFYFSKDSTSWQISREMLLFFPPFLLVNTIYCIIINTYQCEGRMKIVTIMSGVTQLTSVTLALIGFKLIGTNGVWLSYPVNEVLGILILLTIAFVHARRISLKPEVVLMIEPTFGALPEEVMEFTVHTMEEVVNISRNVRDFCAGRKNLDRKQSYFTGLCIEEMAGNIIKHGVSAGHQRHVDVRVVAKDNITIRIRDNCREFDPKKRIEQLSDDDLVTNIGIRVISKLTKEIIYQNNMGINTLLLKVKQ